jgi:hypothetical protein
MPVILSTQEAEIRRIAVQSQPGQIVQETLPQKKPFMKKDWWSNSRYRPCTKKEKKRKRMIFSNERLEIILKIKQ